MTKFNKGDLVRVTYDYEVDVHGEVNVPTLDNLLTNLSIELIKRADDPGNDPVGTVRENTGGYGGTYAYRPSDSYAEPVWRHTVAGFSVRPSDPTLGSIVGAVPSTPAAEVD